jgi:hypothetical protein
MSFVKRALWAIVPALLVAIALQFAPAIQPAHAADLDMKKIFRCQAKDSGGVAACDKARTLLLSNCTTCHVFVAIVVQQFDKEGWNGLFDRHAGRVPQLSPPQIAEMKSYLMANFNPKLDPPELPPELLKEWTAY